MYTLSLKAHDATVATLESIIRDLDQIYNN